MCQVSLSLHVLLPCPSVLARVIGPPEALHLNLQVCVPSCLTQARKQVKLLLSGEITLQVGVFLKDVQLLVATPRLGRNIRRAFKVMTFNALRMLRLVCLARQVSGW